MTTANETEIAEGRSQPPHPIAQRRRPLRDYLFGASGIFDFAGNITWLRVSTVKNRTDTEALAGDWYALGDDFRRAMDRYPVPETQHEPNSNAVVKGR